MFEKAYAIASHFTHPVLLSTRFGDGRIESGVGTFVIINKEGWIVTAGHLLQGLIGFQKKHKDPKKSISHHSMWWGHDSHKISKFELLEGNDLAIGKIENYNPDFQKVYPKFIDPASLKAGTSLCKLGFPFHNVQASFNAQNGQFSYDKSVFPIPRFPIDGIYTRNAVTGKSPDGKYEFKFLETSTPGLRGQSGGPIFDREGNICAIQSQTRHLPLGFSPAIEQNGEKVIENQFLNVGWGVHVESILKYLDDHGVTYEVARQALS
ncbi:Trypsin-like peptidase domain-containing protein [Spirosomataceae bacterium TFI 002]|nr:Trypsin-like peptidase domain-containing protein [Spirosomataceae bacterium TFI 002]